tara:strand:+ start:311 stop:559 length:249 start_codon:yes stop_codon:yes gene_type:complete
VLHERDKLSKEVDLLRATLQALIDDFNEFENAEKSLGNFVESLSDSMDVLVRRRAELSQINLHVDEREYKREMEQAIPSPSV